MKGEWTRMACLNGMEIDGALLPARNHGCRAGVSDLDFIIDLC